MDRNSITGLVLIFVIIAGSFYLMKPSDEEIKRERQLQDSLARAKAGIENVKADATAKEATPVVLDSALLNSPFGPATVGEEKILTLENEHIRASISTKGGRVKSVELKDEKTYDGQPLMLFDGDHNKFGLFFSAAGKNIITNDLFFSTEGHDVQVAGQDSASITFRLTYAPDTYIDYIYSIRGGDHNLGFTIVTKGLQDVVAPTESQLVLNWEASLLQKEKDMKSERQRSTLYYALADGEVDHLSTAEDDEEEVKGKVEWISFKQHFFSNVLVSEQGFNGGKVNVYTSTDDRIVKLFSANLHLDFSRQEINTYPMHFFFGPNQYKVLKAHGYGLEKQIDMGWGPMKWINRFITIPVFNFLDSFNWSYGLVILILTIMLKLVLSPLTYRSYVSMAKMRVLKPEMDQIKEKVGQDNAALLQQEYLKLYKQAGVNPLGGCIPLLLQMPFTIAFFFFFPNLFELRGESFLWVKDLSTYDSPITFAPLPLIGMDHISLMCILMTVATLLSTWYNNTISGAANAQMKYIGYFMPLIFLFVLNSFPAGLNYYYFLSTIFTFGQQVVIRNMINDDKILAIIEANKKKPESQKKKSKFQQRMEDYMRQQQAQGKGKK
ncbi:membrane protein insertase YidC [Parapedobacter indicus]|uniref:Membrane protein insertase YidC n=1 Tax=Parapedobacter indicus TaxID=1477437 RepID=A0A1I3UUD6_9SPHI|nr:membrane protein insertase YidC [Parapedobacter indicus]PPK99067.1 YidC/Oxa1 family membrane protein insertase [Parapedobacter indicus]SFJ86974.1 YidC/Oxa1 family membrane protein insertase [Parapedobacter indicus]